MVVEKMYSCHIILWCVFVRDGFYGIIFLFLFCHNLLIMEGS